jgi:hypothetical protein
VTVEQQWTRFIADVPAGEPPVLHRREFNRWAVAYLSSDPESAGRTPPAVRVPGGPAADIATAWAGDFPYDPGAVRAPSLILRGAWDSLTTDADAGWLMAALSGTAGKWDLKLPRGTHLMHLETGRDRLHRAGREFLLAS